MYCWKNNIPHEGIFSALIVGKTLRVVFVLMAVVLAFGCSDPQKKVVVYYPVDSLLGKQISLLSKKKASLRKVAMFKDKQEKTEYVPKDSLAWVKELEVFSNLEMINKPIHQGYYRVTDGERDKRSNLLIKSFIATEDLPVEYLRVYYQQDLQRIKKLEAKIKEENSMFDGKRFLYMEFEHVDQHPIISYFSIKGGQKMFLGDSVYYTINAAVSLP